MIKTIFFDWGNTLIQYTENLEEKMDRLLGPHNLNWESFYPYWRNFYYLRSKGDIKNDQDMFLQINRVLQKEIPLNEVRDTRLDCSVILKKNIEVVKNLKFKKGYKVGLLSNGIKEWIERKLEKNKINNLFDAVIVSSAVGVRKPNAEIYYVAIKSVSAKPEETIFISDELCDDLVAAKGCGMKTIWYVANSKNKYKIKEMKIAKMFPPDAIIKNFKEIDFVVKNLAKS